MAAAHSWSRCKCPLLFAGATRRACAKRRVPTVHTRGRVRAHTRSHVTTTRPSPDSLCSSDWRGRCTFPSARARAFPSFSLSLFLSFSLSLFLSLPPSLSLSLVAGFAAPICMPQFYAGQDPISSNYKVMNTNKVIGTLKKEKKKVAPAARATWPPYSAHLIQPHQESAVHMGPCG